MSAGTNWAGNYAFRAARVLRPRTVDEVQELVGGADRLRALGTRHCFNDLADSAGDLLSVEELPVEVSVDAARGVAMVSAGTPYGILGTELQRQGYALPNLASLPHISVAGAIATGTHGSGVRNRSLAAAVTALELVDGTGALRRFSAEDRDFPGTVVSLGALGIVTRVELAVEPTFEVAQHVFEAMPLAVALEHFDEVMGAAYSVSMFTTWARPEIEQIWVKRRTDQPAPPPDLFGALPAEVDRHPIKSMPALNSTPQLGRPGPWLDRLPHFRLEFTPSAGDELQTEYLLPRRHAADALTAVAGLADRLAPLLQVSEVRTIAADDLWLSMSSGADAVALHFTWVPDGAAVREVLPALEAALAPFDARPHWGKVFTTSADRLRELYPRLPDFVALVERLDPRGVFRNEYLERTILAG
ncbi:MAG: FAD-binding protein [Naasia sp.]|uniref:D-arabinono-1,4-lactone oxidase n=1 Tax=Naasia sp. TaxID=2546198 RepID=UPI002626913C|nr:D-arabinono-1,4-lactone oxidase [Naasia sp.]MCU1569739.1 FAD-binding protein [Naasia sp.]